MNSQTTTVTQLYHFAVIDDITPERATVVSVHRLADRAASAARRRGGFAQAVESDKLLAKGDRIWRVNVTTI